MRTRTFLLTAILAMAMAMMISGCATTLTMMNPRTTKIETQEKYAGAFHEFEYRYNITAGKIELEKTPMCSEMAKAVRVSQKREIGYGPALLEMPLFGLGLFDIASARAISESSQEITPLSEYETGKLLSCGSPQPAEGEALIIESRADRKYWSATTDRDGKVDLNRIIGGTPEGAMDLNVRLGSNPSVNFACVYEAPRETLLGYAK